MSISIKMQFCFNCMLFTKLFEKLYKNLINLLLLEIYCKIHHHYLFSEKRRIEVEKTWR